MIRNYFSGGTLGDTNVKNNTAIAGATLILVTFIGCLTFMVVTNHSTDILVRVMLPIITTVVSMVFVAGKVDVTQQRVDNASHNAAVAANNAVTAAEYAETTVKQTNGALDARVQDAIVRALQIHEDRQKDDGNDNPTVLGA